MIAISSALVFTSLVRGYLIFAPDLISRRKEPAFERDELFGYAGPLHLGYNREIVFNVPAYLRGEAGERVIVSHLRVPQHLAGYCLSYLTGEWSIAFSPDSVKSVEPGYLYWGFRDWPALRIQLLDQMGNIPTTVCLTFRNEAQREVYQALLEGVPLRERLDSAPSTAKAKPAIAEAVPEYISPKTKELLESFVPQPQKFTARILGAAIAFLVMGTALGIVDKVLGDILRVTLLSSALLGLVIGTCAVKLLELWRVRGQVAVWFLVTLACFAAVGTGFLWGSREMRPTMVETLSEEVGLDRAEALLTPWETLRVYLLQLSEDGIYFSSGYSQDQEVTRYEEGREQRLFEPGLKVEGLVFWAYNFLELAMVLMMAQSWSATRMMCKPFCQACELWLGEEATQLADLSSRELANDIMRCGEWSALSTLPPSSGERFPIRISCFACPRCGLAVGGVVSGYQPPKNVLVRLDTHQAELLLSTLKENAKAQSSHENKLPYTTL